MNIQEFIEKHGITMTADRISARTDHAASNWGKDACHYLITLKCGDRAHVFNYSMGAGHVEKIPYRQIPPDKRRGLTLKDWENTPRPGTRGLTLHQAEYQSYVWRPATPKLADVLDCVASDCAGFDNARSFEDWASEYGYDTDSRKAERTYSAVREQYMAMEAMLGRDALHALMFDVERL